MQTIKERPEIVLVGNVAAADDAQRAILCCVLIDACAWHEKATESCVTCQEVDGCHRHFEQHEAPWREYAHLRYYIKSYQESQAGTTCPLDISQRLVISGALGKAIDYRNDRCAPEDRGLAAAYHALMIGPGQGARAQE